VATKKTAKSRPAPQAEAPSNDRLSKLRELVTILESSSLAELSYTDDDLSVSLSKYGSAAAAPTVIAAPVAAPAPAAPTTARAHDAPVLAEDLTVVRSPFVGTFYRSPKPGAPAFTDVVLSCVQIAPQDRAESMEAVAAQLDAIAEVCERTGLGRNLEGKLAGGAAPDRRYDSESSRG
jgi:biotin carboxyl carrier protein